MQIVENEVITGGDRDEQEAIGPRSASGDLLVPRRVGYSEFAIDAFATWIVEARRQWRQDMERHREQAAEFSEKDQESAQPNAA